MEISPFMNQAEKDRKRNNGNTKHENKLALVNPYISIITLNLSGLISPLKGTEWLNEFLK